MTTETITIYIGRWNDREFVYSLAKEGVKALVEKHFAFGDPAEDEYAVGNIWASGDQDNGWRIVERKVAVPVIGIELKTSQPDDTSHVIWQCPYCKRFYSDEWRPDDKLPILLLCGCEEASKYLLGTSPIPGA